MVVSRLAWSADGLVLAVGLAPRSPDADGSTSGTAAFAISESVRLYTSDGLPLSAVEDEGRSMSSPSTYVSLAPRANNSLLHVSQHTLCPSCPVLGVSPAGLLRSRPRRAASGPVEGEPGGTPALSAQPSLASASAGVSALVRVPLPLRTLKAGRINLVGAHTLRVGGQSAGVGSRRL